MSQFHSYRQIKNIVLQKMNKIVEISKLNQMEMDNDLPFESSWHQTYKDCPWIYFGGVSTELSEGDLICMFSQLLFLFCVDL